ncbi:maleylacetoacetate isomerase [Aliiglaciecola lipolytica]|uniref:Maleylacetoacetate isomerase n=1 Tax=Aliiglaciecola lipolytica E3 TaxID=1127673 RepID=K6YRZ3_9ALTE|nr:maleylacetoacetate isomerase [Aliiglaciecola lipolytica]GAC14080.1 maleylacetoacetate isomerase [Aliiglaciecola lipolytica E3]
MSLYLYGYWRSSATYRARIALNLKQLEYTYVPVNLAKDGGMQFSQDYTALNPSQLVPTFVDDDEDIFLNQSMAIVEYIDERYEEPVKLVPTHRLDRARVRALAQDIGCDIQPITNLRILRHLKSTFQNSDEDNVKWNKHWIETGFKSIEKRLTNTVADYCFGFDVTMADVFLIPQVYNAQRFGVDMGQFPLIQRVHDNCNQIEAFIAAKPENQADAT